MTNREFLNAILSANLSAEMNEKAQALIDTLDKRNAQRSSKPSKRSVENQPVKEAIVAFLRENPNRPASEIGTGCGITTMKASTLCVQLSKEEVLISSEVKFPKKGMVKVYSVK